MQQVELPSARLSECVARISSARDRVGGRSAEAQNDHRERTTSKSAFVGREAPYQDVWWPPNLDGILMATPDDRTD